MTVREAVEVLTSAKMIYVAWNGSLVAEFNPSNKFMLDAFSNYRISSILSTHESGEDSYEIEIASVPAKEAI